MTSCSLSGKKDTRGGKTEVASWDVVRSLDLIKRGRREKKEPLVDR